MKGAKGSVTYCQGQDTAGNAHAMIDAFNKKFSGQGPTAKLVEFPASADEQRNQFIQRQQAKSGDCDVFSADVIWTAEFAAEVVVRHDPVRRAIEGDFLPATLETVHYDKKYWGSPETSDAAFIYYRKDKLLRRPGRGRSSTRRPLARAAWFSRARHTRG